jgi:glycosyltransferase involved in cell wall biosynthesis
VAKVSVIIPAYNHDKYIAQCLESVLNQTFQDFEIILTDDGSVDQTVAIIESFTDPRLKLYRHPRNQGASLAANHCLQQARGDYIAMLSSDDAWYPEKLSLQVRHLDDHPELGAVFGKVLYVDELDHPLTGRDLPYVDVFDVHNRTRFEWLRYFFERGNCLCHPSSLVRRDCYTEIGLLNPAFAYMPDFDLWIRLCLRYEIAVLDQKLVRFRKFPVESNASGETPQNRRRLRYEFRQALNHYRALTEPAEFKRVFPEASQYGPVTTAALPYLLGRIAIASGWDFKVLWGLDLIYAFLQDPGNARLLEQDYHFTFLDFIALTGDSNAFGNLSHHDLADNIPVSLMLRSVALKAAAQPGLHWLKRFKTLGRKAVIPQQGR